MRSRVHVFLLIITAIVLLPSRWWASAGAPSVTQAQAAVVQAGPAQTYEGILNVVWGDPRRGSGMSGVVQVSLSLADGTTVPLEFAGQENAALAHFGKRVVVTGRPAARATSTAGTTADGAVLVESIVPAEPVAQGASAAPALGTKKVLFLLLKFSDDAAVPHPPSFFLNLANPDTPSTGIPATINAFFKKTSNNQFSWVADVGGVGGVGAPGGWITLPGAKATYANCGFSGVCFNFSLFNTDAVAAGKAQGINFAVYDNINFVVSNDLDCCAWGGGTSIDGKSFGATWEPPWGQETEVYSHEMGHSLGLPHSGWVYFAYDSPWDVMSTARAASAVNCGSYLSKNGGGTSNLTCTEPGASYIAAYRDYLGWFPTGNVVQTTTASPVNVTLEGTALPVGATPKMIKICLPGLSCTSRYFTVEARVKALGATSQFDNGIPGEGVIIHEVWTSRPPISGPCFFNSQSGWAVPVDATPGDYTGSPTCGAGGRVLPNYALNNAQFTAGQTYTNSTFGFTVSVLSRSGSNFQVSVSPVALPSDIALDSPANGSTVPKPFTVSGWAINRQATSGTGVDAVHVYATPTAGGAAIFLGAATYGTARGDIGALYGAQFTNSGFTLSAGASLAPGAYTVTAYAHNAASGAFDGTRSASITVTGPVSNGLINIDSPTNGQVVTSAFEIGGWAADLGAPSGTGVDAIQFYVFPNDGASPGVFVGNGSYGAARADVGAAYGSRFTNSGFHFTITGLGPGAFLLGAYARSTVTGAYSVVKTIHISVNPNQLMSIDTPSPESSVSAAVFDVAGWSIDRAVATGTGVDTLHVYAYPNPGSGQAPIFLGIATVGFARSDVAALYGARFTNSGYNLTVSRAAVGLTPGVYSIVVHSHSTSGSFNNLAVVRVTLQ